MKTLMIVRLSWIAILGLSVYVYPFAVGAFNWIVETVSGLLGVFPLFAIALTFVILKLRKHVH